MENELKRVVSPKPSPESEAVARFRERVTESHNLSPGCVVCLEVTDLRSVLAQLEQSQDRVEELEQSCEDVSEEFEKDCWKALRSLLDECDWDWSSDPDTTADSAREHISITISEMQAQIDSQKAKLEQSKRRVETARRDAIVTWLEVEGRIRSEIGQLNGGHMVMSELLGRDFLNRAKQVALGLPVHHAEVAAIKEQA